MNRYGAEMVSLFVV